MACQRRRHSGWRAEPVAIVYPMAWGRRRRQLRDRMELGYGMGLQFLG